MDRIDCRRTRGAIIAFLAVLILLAAGCQTTSIPSATKSAAPADGAEVVWNRLHELQKRSEQEWTDGRYLDALLTLEHAVTLVILHDISEEGGHDYLIKRRVMQLYDMERYADLETALRQSEYYPQTARWILGFWAEELGPLPEAAEAADERRCEAGLEQRREGSTIADLFARAVEERAG